MTRAAIPDWLPRVFEIQGERFEEGAEFIQVSQQPLLGRDEAHFLIDEMDEFREIRMHCTISGMFAHWQLTEAQGGRSLLPYSGWNRLAVATAQSTSQWAAGSSVAGSPRRW